jgi:peptidoglycan/LPS O-acetylase OafA/YrhL
MREYKQNCFFLWTYTYNYKELINVLQGNNGNLSPFFSHLWSLSVEEQFYILLPVMVFFTSNKGLKRLILAIIILSPLVRLATYFYYDHLSMTAAYLPLFKGDEILRESWVTVIILRTTWCQLDCLAFGMALAVWGFDWIKSPRKVFFWAFAFFVAVVTVNGIIYAQKMDLPALLANPMFSYKKVVEMFPEWFAKFYISVSDHHSLVTNHQYAYIFTVVNTLSFLIVLSCIRDQPIFNFFRNEKVIYTGKITYGAYLFHYPLLMFLIIFLGFVFVKFDRKFGQLGFEFSMMLVYLPLLWVLSHWSYKYFEMYFMKLKDKVK